jgi:hypothetical protein
MLCGIVQYKEVTFRNHIIIKNRGRFHPGSLVKIKVVVTADITLSSDIYQDNLTKRPRILICRHQTPVPVLKFSAISSNLISRFHKKYIVCWL